MAHDGDDKHILSHAPSAPSPSSSPPPPPPLPPQPPPSPPPSLLFFSSSSHVPNRPPKYEYPHLRS
ncbi:hypothetical protein TWF730_001234 [Orbilia blumenaviensis]|uniref:Uncharacterized protein n=1 Tax=Orbilia blumenaviensis TaxID=1796055 RepID=A0AAV9VQ25_9PEZI